MNNNMNSSSNNFPAGNLSALSPASSLPPSSPPRQDSASFNTNNSNSFNASTSFSLMSSSSNTNNSLSLSLSEAEAAAAARRRKSSLYNNNIQGSSSNSSSSSSKSRSTWFVCSISIRTVLAIFYFVLFTITWSIPTALILDSTGATVTDSLKTISRQTAKGLATGLSESIAASLHSGVALANLTHLLGNPSSNYSTTGNNSQRNISRAEKIDLYEKSFVEKVSRVNPRRWPSLFCRWMDGSSFYGYHGAEDLFITQFCVKPENKSVFGGVWQPEYNDGRPFSSIPPYPSNINQCRVHAYNLTTKTLLPPSHPANKNFIFLRARTFAMFSSWNQSISQLMRSKNLPSGAALPYGLSFVAISLTRSNDDLLIDTEDHGLQLATNHYTKFQGDPTSSQSSTPSSQYYDPSTFVSVVSSSVEAAGFATELRRFLPPDPNARAFVTSEIENDENRVLFWSHGSPIETYKYNISDPMFLPSKGCFLNGRRDVAACLYNISDHESYRLLRLALKFDFSSNLFFTSATSLNDADLEGNQSLHVALMNPNDDANSNNNNQQQDVNLLLQNDDTYVYSHFSGLNFFARDMHLHTFIPVKLYTSEIYNATLVVIIVTVVMVVVGLLLSYLILTSVTSRIEKLAHEMYRDPFAKRRTKNTEATTTSLSVVVARMKDFLTTFSELEFLQDEFEKLRVEIENLRGFMPYKTTKNVGKFKIAESPRYDDNHHHHHKPSTSTSAENSKEDANDDNDLSRSDSKELIIDSSQEGANSSSDDEEQDLPMQMSNNDGGDLRQQEKEATTHQCRETINNKKNSGSDDESPNNNIAFRSSLKQKKSETSQQQPEEATATTPNSASASAFPTSKGVKFRSEAIVVEIPALEDPLAAVGENSSSNNGVTGEHQHMTPATATSNQQQDDDDNDTSNHNKDTTVAATQSKDEIPSNEEDKECEGENSSEMKKPILVPVVFEPAVSGSATKKASLNNNNNNTINNNATAAASSTTTQSESNATAININDHQTQKKIRYMIASVSILGNEIISEILLRLSDDRERDLSPYHRRVLDNIVKVMMVTAKQKEEENEEGEDATQENRQEPTTNISFPSQSQSSSSPSSGTPSGMISSEKKLQLVRQYLVDRSTFIVETIFEHLLKGSGAHIIEYRNDNFLICLKLSLKTSHSRLAQRFLYNLVKIAEQILQNHEKYHLPFVVVRASDENKDRRTKKNDVENACLLSTATTSPFCKQDEQLLGNLHAGFKKAVTQFVFGDDDENEDDHDDNSGQHGTTSIAKTLQNFLKEQFDAASFQSSFSAMNTVLTAGLAAGDTFVLSSSSTSTSTSTTFTHPTTKETKSAMTKDEVLVNIHNNNNKHDDNHNNINSTTNDNDDTDEDAIDRAGYNSSSSSSSTSLRNTMMKKKNKNQERQQQKRNKDKKTVLLSRPVTVFGECVSEATAVEAELRKQVLLGMGLLVRPHLLRIKKAAFEFSDQITRLAELVQKLRPENRTNSSNLNQPTRQLKNNNNIHTNFQQKSLQNPSLLHPVVHHPNDDGGKNFVVATMMANDDEAKPSMCTTSASGDTHPSSDVKNLLSTSRRGSLVFSSNSVRGVAKNLSTSLSMHDKQELVDFIGFFVGRKSVQDQLSEILPELEAMLHVEALPFDQNTLATTTNTTSNTENDYDSHRLLSMKGKLMVSSPVEPLLHPPSTPQPPSRPSSSTEVLSTQIFLSEKRTPTPTLITAAAAGGEENNKNNKNEEETISNNENKKLLREEKKKLMEEKRRILSRTEERFNFCEGRGFPHQDHIDALPHAIAFVHSTTAVTLKHPNAFFAKASWTSVSPSSVLGSSRVHHHLHHRYSFSGGNNIDNHHDDYHRHQQQYENGSDHFLQLALNQIEIGRVLAASFPAPLKALLSSNLTEEQRAEVLRSRLQNDEEREEREKMMMMRMQQQHQSQLQRQQQQEQQQKQHQKQQQKKTRFVSVVQRPS